MTIYVVTSGEYSDYCINAVFTDRKQAELYCAVENGKRGNYYRCDIEEYEADTPVLEGEVYYGIRFTAKKRVSYTETIYSTMPVEFKKVDRRDDYLIEIPTNQAYHAERRRRIAQDYLAKMRAEEKGL